MGATKRICELMTQALLGGSRTAHAIVRFGNVLGSRGSVVPVFQKQIARGGPVTLTHAEVQRYLMTISEAVDLVIRSGTLASAGEIFILDMGDPVPILNLARDLVELSGLRPDRDIRIEITNLRPGEKLSEELFDPSQEMLVPTEVNKVRVVKGDPFDSSNLMEKIRALETAALEDRLEEIGVTLKELNIGVLPNRKLDFSALTD